MLVKQRELTKAEVLGAEKAVFDQRNKLKDTKRRLGIKADDEDLINQKVGGNTLLSTMSASWRVRTFRSDVT